MNRVLGVLSIRPIGKKTIMAVTGLIGVGFVIAHMAGNLQVFHRAAKLNALRRHAARAARRAALARACRAARVARAARADGVAADASSRAARPVGYHDARAAGVDARVAHDALGRRAAARVHRLPHPALHDRDDRTRRWTRHASTRLGHATSTATSSASFRIWWVAAFYIVAMISSACTSTTAPGAPCARSGYANPSRHTCCSARMALAIASSCGSASHSFPSRVLAGLIR